MRRDSARILLFWPGSIGAASGNFGVPQLVTMATYLRVHTGAEVTIIDLACEAALGPIDLPKLFLGPNGTGYDVVGFSCYASYDFLKIDAIARVARAVLPRAAIVVGGYHPSARPADFLDNDAPFDAVIIGEGEKTLVQIVEMVQSGERPQKQIFPSNPIADLNDLPPTDWTYLSRYLPILPKVASQVQIYLSRGCPFDCAFCMERAKREVSWRAFTVERALDEVRRLSEFVNLQNLTVYIADALFGMRASFRRAFLEGLAASNIKAKKWWLLIRVDLMEDDDLTLFRNANCAPGFGLESGDPTLLGIIRKAGRLEDYLDRMRHIAARARELQVPWGANVIVGHPGETESTLHTTAAYLNELFLDPKGTTGFLSVDPFRLYPGSPIDHERLAWQQRFGTRFHRPEWWKDGDQEFLSEWVDPSHSLTYRRRAELTHQLFAPILSAIPKQFVYTGPSRPYFMRAVEHQIQDMSAASRLHMIDRFYAWHRYLGKSARGRSELLRDTEAASLLRDRRRASLKQYAKNTWPNQPTAHDKFFQDPIVQALVHVPRERFVPLDSLLESTRDVAVSQGNWQSTVSAFHAYLAQFQLAHIRAGSHVLDLGSGTGYGTALLSAIVGKEGRVVSMEVDPELVRWAEREVPAAVADLPNSGSVVFLGGDSLSPQCASWAHAALCHSLTVETSPGFHAVVCGFALSCIPPEWVNLLREGGSIVAPVLTGTTQFLTRATRQGDRLVVETFGEVRYVQARHADLTRPGKDLTRLAT
ncbi:MAG: cobalamin-dependent protein [Polyangiaceae bacterium]|nr:cobalamin-dependent protein [Polyangiaceae bacterium]